MTNRTRERGKRKAPETAGRTPRAMLIRDLDRLKALSDPLRVRILQGFASGARTVKEVAEAIGENRSLLYHHIGILENAGLLEVIETRPVRGTTEKHYRPAATRFEVDGSVFSDESPDEADLARVEMVSSLLAQTRAEILDSQRELATGGAEIPRPFLARMVFKGTPDEATALAGRIQSFLGECCPADPPQRAAGEVRDYAITVAMCALQPGDPHERA